MTLKSFLSQNKFYKLDDCIKKENSVLNFGKSSLEISKEKGCVYLIVLETEGKPRVVIYVGQTSNTINDRMIGHRRGSKWGAHKKGNANASCYKKFIADDYLIQVYFRISKTVKVLNQEVSICGAEERALMELFSQDEYKYILLNKKTGNQKKREIDLWYTEVRKILKSSNYDLSKLQLMRASKLFSQRRCS